MGIRQPLFRVLLRYLIIMGGLLAIAFLSTRLAVHAANDGSLSSQQTPVPILFGPPPIDEDLPPGIRDDQAVTRYRFATVKFDLLGSALQDSQNSTTSINLNLFNDVTVEALLDRVEILPTGGYVWIGTVRDIDYSQVIIVVNDGRATASVRVPGGNIQILPEGGAMHSIRELDESLLNPEEDDAISEPQTVGAASVTAASAITADDGSVVDVMVVYGPDARSEVGGTAAMLDRVALGMTEANTTLTNSGAGFQYRLVHTHEVTYTSSSGASTDLFRLRQTTDGYMDEIHALRDTYGADLVSLWLRDGGCGRGYLWSYDATAFSVARLNCATGNLTFGHEFGHNFGARHDWYVDPTIDSPTYNHGYVDNSLTWRTNMAYSTECWDANDVGCTRLLYLSNPSISYNGTATGTASGTSTACTYRDLNNPDCDADNMQLMDGRAVTVANFRQRQVPYAVEQIAPMNTITTTTPTLEWRPDAIATEYVVAIYDETNDAVIFYNDTAPYTAGTICTGSDPATDTCAVQPSVTLSTGVAYRWLLLARNGTINGPWSSYP